MQKFTVFLQNLHPLSCHAEQHSHILMGGTESSGACPLATIICRVDTNRSPSEILPALVR
jgi:hypothetical protein